MKTNTSGYFENVQIIDSIWSEESRTENLGLGLTLYPSRLYMLDSYVVKFKSRVKHVGENAVVLHGSYFFPTSGGQPSDTGILRLDDGVEIRVLEVMLSDDKTEVIHKVSSTVNFKAEDIVVGVIDEERRLDMMQHHSGQHLLSWIVGKVYDLSTKSVHFGDSWCTIDFEGGKSLVAESLMREFNLLVTRGLPFILDFHGEKRITRVSGFEDNPCCGTHVKSLSHIGSLYIKSIQELKSKTVVTYVVGRRATNIMMQLINQCNWIQKSLNSGMETCPGLVDQLIEKNKKLQKDLLPILEELAEYKSKAIIQKPEKLTIVSDISEITPLENRIAKIISAIKESDHIYIVKPEKRAPPFNILVATTCMSKLKANEFVRQLTTIYGGRGGGQERLASASLGMNVEIEQLIRACTHAPPQ